MEQAIISLVSLTVAVMFYLDRGRRADLRRLEGQLEKRFDKIDERFETVDKRFDKIDERFGTVDERFGTFDKRFETFEQKLDKKINDSAARTDARINDLNRSVIELAQSLGRVEGRTETLAAVE